MNEICTRLKTLRTERNMTQTDVAHALGVTTQAVSRWESQTTLPDITLLVPIAEFYGVTTDHLLGHDIKEKEKEILEYLDYCESSFAFNSDDKWNEIIEKTRSMLRRHPTDHRLMLELCNELFMLYKRCDSDTKHLEELIEWGNIIINHSTDNHLRYEITKLIIYTYHELGMYENVKRLVEGLPDLSESSDALQYFCNPPDTSETIQSEKTFVYKCLDNICASMLKYGTDIEGQAFTTKEKLSICQTVASIVKAYHSHGDYDGNTLEYLYRAELYTSFYYAMDDNTDDSLTALEKASLAFEKLKVASSGISYSSPFLKGITSPHGCKKERYQKLLRNVTERKCFDKIRDNVTFKNIVKKVLDM